MILHRECKAGVHLQRPSVIRAGGDRAGRPWPWGPPGPSGCCVGEWTELDGLCARRSGLRFWCLESLFQASSWLLVLFFFFFFFSAEIVSAAHRAGVLQHLGILSPRAAWGPGLRFGTVVTMALCSFAFLQQELH